MPGMPRGAGRLYIAWIVVLAVVAWLTLKYETQAAHFYGIAETKEIVVNTEAAVEIKKIAVIEGQTVNRGQLLVQLSSPEMTSKIAQLSHQIQELQATKGATKTDLRAQIAQLRAQRATKVAEIQAQIGQLENQYRINKSLSSGLKSLRPQTKSAGTQNPLTLRVAALKRELSLSLQPLNIRIKALQQQQISAPTNAAQIQVERLEQQLRLLRAENDKLKIVAQIAGVIGSVNFKPGAKVAPFAAILTLHARSPSFIKGYIHENMHSSVALGDEVKVLSLAGGGVVNAKREAIAGKVVGVGSRIVPYPKRLCKNQEIQLWGREVLVRIPTDSALILGEKVMIETAQKKGGSRGSSSGHVEGQAEAAPRPGTPAGKPAAAGARKDDAEKNDAEKNDAEQVRPIRNLRTGIEASAVHYLPPLARYLVLSDDTPNNRPLVFLVDHQGVVTDELPIEGLKKVRDLEAVAADDRGRLYLACSQNRSKGGKLKRSRRLLLRVTRKGKRLILDRAVDLHGLLKAAARAEARAPWARWFGPAPDVDLEGLAFYKGALLLGYKAPLADGHSLILRLGRLDALFADQRIAAGAVSIFKRLRLQAKAGRSDRISRGRISQGRISGLLRVGDQLLVTATAKGGDGSLWRVALDGQAARPVRLRSFVGLRPEGLSLGPQPGQIFVTFDQGGDAASRFTLIKVSR